MGFAEPEKKEYVEGLDESVKDEYVEGLEIEESETEDSSPEVEEDPYTRDVKMSLGAQMEYSGLKGFDDSKSIEENLEILREHSPDKYDIYIEYTFNKLISCPAISLEVKKTFDWQIRIGHGRNSRNLGAINTDLRAILSTSDNFDTVPIEYFQSLVDELFSSIDNLREQRRRKPKKSRKPLNAGKYLGLLLFNILQSGSEKKIPKDLWNKLLGEVAYEGKGKELKKCIETLLQRDETSPLLEGFVKDFFSSKNSKEEKLRMWNLLVGQPEKFRSESLVTECTWRLVGDFAGDWDFFQKVILKNYSKNNYYRLLADYYVRRSLRFPDILKELSRLFLEGPEDNIITVLGPEILGFLIDFVSVRVSDAEEFLKKYCRRESLLISKEQLAKIVNKIAEYSKTAKDVLSDHEIINSGKLGPDEIQILLKSVVLDASISAKAFEKIVTDDNLQKLRKKEYLTELLKRVIENEVVEVMLYRRLYEIVERSKNAKSIHPMVIEYVNYHLINNPPDSSSSAGRIFNQLSDKGILMKKTGTELIKKIGNDPSEMSIFIQSCSIDSLREYAGLIMARMQQYGFQDSIKDRIGRERSKILVSVVGGGLSISKGGSEGGLSMIEDIEQADKSVINEPSTEVVEKSKLGLLAKFKKLFSRNKKN